MGRFKAEVERKVLTTLLGVLASMLTTVSYIPQLAKAWRSGETGDVSLRMLLILLAGLILWTAYGFLKADWVIVVANTTSSILLLAILGLKFRASTS